MLNRSDIATAAARIAGHVRHTPLLRVAGEELRLAYPVVLKLELLQHAGSFKPRGAFNRLLSAELPRAGVIAASGGNHGAAVAYAARALGATAEIFVPELTPAAKVARIASYGARVVQTGATYAEALAASRTGRQKPAHWKCTRTTTRLCWPGRALSAASSNRMHRISRISSWRPAVAA